MKKPIEWAANLYKRVKGSISSSGPRPSVEEVKEVIDSAADFDKLIVLPGWERVCKYMVTEVNREIAEATQHKYAPEMMMIHIHYWNSKRELVDGIMAYIDSMQRSRDEIVEQYRGEKNEPSENVSSGTY